jgi:NAD(P)-dependent dehydrogenase (short-subunit alcohol dehydrogenase family)
MDMAGRTILITGSTDGVGRYIARPLAVDGAHGVTPISTVEQGGAAILH